MGWKYTYYTGKKLFSIIGELKHFFKIILCRLWQLLVIFVDSINLLSNCFSVETYNQFHYICLLNNRQ